MRLVLRLLLAMPKWTKEEVKIYAEYDIVLQNTTFFFRLPGGMVVVYLVSSRHQQVGAMKGLSV